MISKGLESLEIIRDYHNQISLLCKGKLNNRIINAENQIEKDLEVLEQLEILKKYYPPFREFLEEMFEKGYNEDLTKIKEWLEND